MIRFALRCDKDHSFESWFQSGAAYDTLRAGGHVSCPSCGSSRIEKQLMAPAVRPSEKAPALAAPADPQQEALAALRREIEANATYVGMNFATEARAMHAGEREARAIYGEARPEEARALIEEGVPVAPLPFLPKQKAN
ncbi:DUF1178 family protein [Plastorhodobacter daqingensis]|uniref:DUF1178 family protein n=1 Tax=Plastorhodobacter daqingensis TaxID=1387281 RepID=A0ABW2UQP3_9RHOB